jgi:hypothetical protein
MLRLSAVPRAVVGHVEVLDPLIPRSTGPPSSKQPATCLHSVVHVSSRLILICPLTASWVTPSTEAGTCLSFNLVAGGLVGVTTTGRFANEAAKLVVANITKVGSSVHSSSVSPPSKPNYSPTAPEGGGGAGRCPKSAIK